MTTPTRRRRAPASPRALLDSAISEKAFQAQVVQLATLNGWLVFHPYDSRRSTPGFPDLTLCRPPRLLLAEIKTQRGQVRQAQREWLAALRQCPEAEVYLWRPGNWDEIERVLR